MIVHVDSLFRDFILFWVALKWNCSTIGYPIQDPGIRNQIYPQPPDAVWKGLADVILHVPLHRFGTISLDLFSVPLPLMLWSLETYLFNLADTNLI